MHNCSSPLPFFHGWAAWLKSHVVFLIDSHPSCLIYDFSISVPLKWGQHHGDMQSIPNPESLHVYHFSQSLTIIMPTPNLAEVFGVTLLLKAFQHLQCSVQRYCNCPWGLIFYCSLLSYRNKDNWHRHSWDHRELALGQPTRPRHTQQCWWGATRREAAPLASARIEEEDSLSTGPACVWLREDAKEQHSFLRSIEGY